METVRALAASGRARRLSLLVGHGDAHPAVPPALARLEAEESGVVRLCPIGAGLRTPADQWQLPRLLAALRPDVFHAPYYAIPVALPGRVVITIHDLIPFLFPRYWPNAPVRRGIQAWTAYAVRRADRIIVPSQSAGADLARLLPASGPKVRVVLEGVSPPPTTGHAASRAEPGTDAPYLLYVGSNKPHKNLPRLVAAFARVAPEVAGRLIIAGAWDERYPQARDDVRRHGLEDRVTFEHAPSDSRLHSLYAAATGFVFPSLYEGFGLPVLEAMAAGLPVATSARGSLGELAGDAALLFDPEDTDAIAVALRQLLGDEGLRARLSAASRARAALFPWSRTGEETWRVYEEVACASSTSIKTSIR